MVGKTRHREYMDAIKYTKERVDVDSDYSPFRINRSLMKTPEDVFLLNTVNHKKEYWVLNLRQKTKARRNQSLHKIEHKEIHGPPHEKPVPKTLSNELNGLSRRWENSLTQFTVKLIEVGGGTENIAEALF